MSPSGKLVSFWQYRIQFDGIVAVGGGSTIDTAKVANLYTTYPPKDFLDYVNPPIGKGVPVTRALKTIVCHTYHGRNRQ